MLPQTAVPRTCSFQEGTATWLTVLINVEQRGWALAHAWPFLFPLLRMCATPAEC